MSPVAAVLLTPSVYNDETVSPGWLGLVVFLAMAVGTFFLLRSMFRHLRKVPKSFDGKAGRAADDNSPGPAGPPPP